MSIDQFEALKVKVATSNYNLSNLEVKEIMTLCLSGASPSSSIYTWLKNNITITKKIKLDEPNHWGFYNILSVFNDGDKKMWKDKCDEIVSKNPEVYNSLTNLKKEFNS